MKHARDDYQDRIVDLAKAIPEDEPVMLFRAQDKHFLAVLSHYFKIVGQDGGDPKIMKAVADHMARAVVWQHNHKTKAPDMP